MSSPVHYSKDLDAALMYAPPWARKTNGEAGFIADLPVSSPPTSPDEEYVEPNFVGDREMRSLRHRLSLDPEIVPEPPRTISRGLRLGRIALRLSLVAAAAALVAWTVSSLPVNVVKSRMMQAAAATTAFTATAVKLLDFRAVIATPVVRAAPRVSAAPIAVQAPPKLAAVPQVAEPPRPRQARLPVTERQAQAAPDPEKTLTLSADEIAMLVKRGKDYLIDGDISSARLLLRRATDAGSAEAALALGSTFDPAVIERLGAIGVQADAAKAREWYQRAAKLGLTQPSGQLANVDAFGR